MPTPHPEFIVSKKGKYDTEHWSTRVVTVDVARRRVYLSRHKHPEELYYHRMEITELWTWPKYDFHHIEEDFQSVVAQLTFTVQGKCSEWRESTVDSMALQLYATNNEVPHGEYSTPKEEVWVLRCSTKPDLDNVLATLHSVLPPPPPKATAK